MSTHFGKTIRTLRIEKRITLRKAVELSGIHCVRLSELERCVAKQPPSQEELDSLAKAYQSNLPFEIPYQFDQKRLQEEEKMFELIRTKSPEELLQYGIFVCRGPDWA